MSDLLDDIETIAREQVQAIRDAVGKGYALSFEDVRKLETLAKVISVTRAEARRVEKESGGVKGMSDDELDAVLRGSETKVSR